MANGNGTSSNPAMDQLIERAMKAEAEAAKLKAELEASKNSIQIEASIADYGKGTISIRGINRWPISLYPVQLRGLIDYLNSPSFQSYINNPDTTDRLRCAAFASEFAGRMGKEWPATKPLVKDGVAANAEYERKVDEFKAAYNQGYALAKADKTLVSNGKVKSSSSTTDAALVR